MTDRHVDLHGEHGLTAEAAEAAKAQLAKLPILGPVIWLYGRDATRRYTFVGELDAVLLPPLVLDQCKIYFKDGVPWGFVSWATVSDPVHARLRSGIGKLAPHEWKSGSHAWLVDVICPFGTAAELVDDIRKSVFAGVPVSQLASSGDGKVEVLQHAAVGAADAVRH